jgi:hypothetical protein
MWRKLHFQVRLSVPFCPKDNLSPKINNNSNIPNFRLSLSERDNQAQGAEGVKGAKGIGVLVLATVGNLPTNKLEVGGLLASQGEVFTSPLYKHTTPHNSDTHPKHKQQTQYPLLINFDSYSLRQSVLT